MSNIGIMLVGCDAGISKTAHEVLRKISPDAPVSTAKNTEDALGQKPTAQTALLVLAHPNPADVTKVVEATDATGLPRWAVVILGPGPANTGVEMLSPEEWSEVAVARTFHSALARHALSRELARAQGDLLAIGTRITHDLRTQVAGILATSELLRAIMADGEASRSELTEPIFESVDGLGKIIERLSFMGKVSASPGIAKSPVDMAEIIFRALQRRDREILKKTAVVVEPAFWPAVEGNAVWLEKIWLNLIANALVHGGDGVKIELGWTKEEGGHRFWIRDNGPGVSPEKRTQLFQPFHLMHHTNSPRGLGLPIVQRLVELHGGRCGYEPRAEGGAFFFFTLPGEGKNSSSRPSQSGSEKNRVISGRG